MQRLVGSHAQLLDDAVRAKGVLQPGEQLMWVSPRAADNWAEYRDGEFLEQIGHPELSPALATFWPRGGPQWDALGRGDAGTVLLVEAKAHLSELASTCTASPQSRARIEHSLEETKRALGARADADWLTGYYQYANRLAHLHFLRALHVPAILIFLYFTNDQRMNGPISCDGWSEGLRAVYAHLGLPPDVPIPHVTNVYLDTRELA
ncbi:MAG TPA: hypothetical protein VF166_10865 [Gemmatimonadaceae bacterium]